MKGWACMTGARILVIEDEPGTRQMTLDVLMALDETSRALRLNRTQYRVLALLRANDALSVSMPNVLWWSRAVSTNGFDAKGTSSRLAMSRARGNQVKTDSGELTYNA